jgi:glycosyltransferase involved in cell wall biosynthesis
MLFCNSLMSSTTQSYSESPLVSYCLVAFRQERFIEHAVRSALLQTYRPLQIIISDDASPDATPEIVSSLAASYAGPHQVVVNRLKTNVGLVGNLNACFSQAAGEYLVPAAGDDIAEPDRVAKLVARLRSQENPVDIACSYFGEIDEAGQSTGYVKKEVVFTPDAASPVRSWRCGATGACVAYHRSLWDDYGPLDTHVVSEDWVYSFRAWLNRGIAIVPEPLVKHRTHSESLSVRARSVKALPSKTARMALRKKMATSSWAIAKEWHRAWLLRRGQDNLGIHDQLAQLVAIRAAKVSAFDASPMLALRLSLRVALLGEPLYGLKIALRRLLWPN